MSRLTCVALVFGFFLWLPAGPGHAAAAPGQPPVEDLALMSLEQLMEVTVISTSKKEEKWFQSSSAVFVITQEDIRRSGILELPEIFRIVPGMQVARLDANKWGISARGFNGRFSNKLLVLVDGRTVYNDIFGGMVWDEYQLPLETIERIEVIRGPGGTLWGANAMNGVINIITKNAKDSQGAMITAGAGTRDRGFTTLRYGGRLAEDAYYRVYGKYFNQRAFDPNGVDPAHDAFFQGRGGFRIDAKRSKNTYSLSGDFFQGETESRTLNAFQSLTAPFTQSFLVNERVEGQNLQGSWQRELSATSSWQAQIFWNREHRSGEARIPEFTQNVLDVQLQYSATILTRHEVVVGFAQRYTYDGFNNTVTQQFIPASRLNYRIDGFIQDQIRLIPDRLTLTLGTKLETNNYTSFEFQPTARLSWTPTDRMTLWTSVSRAVRTPSRALEGTRLNLAVIPQTPPTPNILTALFGSPDFSSEDLTAFEIGYRLRPHDNLYFDVAAFFNIYNEIQSLERGTPTLQTTPSVHLLLPITFDNNLHGESYGVEVASQWQALDWWKLSMGFTWLEFDLNADSHSTATPIDRNLPQFQAQLRSWMDLTQELALDAAAYYVDELKGLNIPRYTRVDLRLGWRPDETWEVSLGILNLQDPRHPEFQETPGFEFSSNTLIPRTIYGKVSARW